ncbi:MAG: cellulase family glycosylhydrolase [Oscillospiraceae bacterium]|nr:cellulase family glycosylhydrolase [Oscillospiraceae bacterium]
MKRNAFFSGITSLIVAAASCNAMTGIGAFAASGAGGYSWEKTVGYQEGTDTLTDSDGQTTITFSKADQGDNVAGFCAQSGDGWDWSDYTRLSFTLTNDSKDTIGFQIALGTGANWSWYQTANWTTLEGGESTELSYYLQSDEWMLDGKGDVTSLADAYAVHRINMMVMPASEGKTISGSVTISNLELGGSASETVEPKDGFYVDGAVLRDANHNPFIMRGTNYAYTWYSWDGLTEAALKEISDYGANVVRIVLGNGVKYDKNKPGEVAHLIEECAKNNLVAVFEVHDVTGDNSKESLLTAAKYFADDLAGVLKGHEDTVIINIANEWQGTGNDSEWASAYTEAVKVIRDAGLQHCIMCDAGGWGQTASTVINGGAKVLEADPEHNTMFSVHMYGYAGGTKSMIKSIMDSMKARNLCLVIGEFGYKHSDGDVQEDYIMEYAEQQEIGWMAWSWYGNGGGVEYLDMSNANAGGKLSAEWGEVVINGANGWKETAKKCTVFTDEPIKETTTVTTTTTAVTTTTTTVITKDSATTTITTTTTDASTSVPEAVLLGDTNDDGSVDVADAVLLARYLAEDNGAIITGNGLRNADVNKDTVAGTDDVILILQFVAMIIDQF